MSRTSFLSKRKWIKYAELSALSGTSNNTLKFRLQSQWPVLCLLGMQSSRECPLLKVICTIEPSVSLFDVLTHNKHGWVLLEVAPRHYSAHLRSIFRCQCRTEVEASGTAFWASQQLLRNLWVTPQMRCPNFYCLRSLHAEVLPYYEQYSVSKEFRG